jgi:NitT/TauT family transport system permease protein
MDDASTPRLDGSPRRRATPPIRPEFENNTTDELQAGDPQVPLSSVEKLFNITAVRRCTVLLVLIAVWQVYAGYLDNPLTFPTVGATFAALWDSLVLGPLLTRVWNSIAVLLLGYSIGIVLATILTALAATTRIASDLLTTLTAMLNPLPAIALLPLALLWFGLGTPSLAFVIVHSVLWPVALNTYSGFLAVSETQRLVGKNYDLRGFRYAARILIPAAFPSILAGLKIGWAFAWRTLIAAELVFGVSSRSGGIGWFIFEKRNQLETDYVFAGLICVVLIGLLMEGVIFRAIEIRTVRKWGMQRS